MFTLCGNHFWPSVASGRKMSKEWLLKPDLIGMMDHLFIISIEFNSPRVIKPIFFCSFSRKRATADLCASVYRIWRVLFSRCWSTKKVCWVSRRFEHDRSNIDSFNFGSLAFRAAGLLFEYYLQENCFQHNLSFFTEGMIRASLAITGELSRYLSREISIIINCFQKWRPM